MVKQVLIVSLLTVLSGCIDPDGTRPGLGLTGEVQPPPLDWEFTNEYMLVAIEVQTPYLLPHSVTIWCVSREGRLYVAARAPDTKNWPGWVERDANVRLKIAGNLYEVQLARLNDDAEIASIVQAYAVKYKLPDRTPEDPPMRYWLVEARG